MSVGCTHIYLGFEGGKALSASRECLNPSTKLQLSPVAVFVGDAPRVSIIIRLGGS